MMYLQAIGLGFCLTFGMELALGLCFAIKAVLKGASRR